MTVILDLTQTAQLLTQRPGLLFPAANFSLTKLSKQIKPMLFYLPNETEGSQRPSLIPESLHPCASPSGVTLPVSRRHSFGKGSIEYLSQPFGRIFFFREILKFFLFLQTTTIEECSQSQTDWLDGLKTHFPLAMSSSGLNLPIWDTEKILHENWVYSEY